MAQAQNEVFAEHEYVATILVLMRRLGINELNFDQDDFNEAMMHLYSGNPEKGKVEMSYKHASGEITVKTSIEEEMH